MTRILPLALLAVAFCGPAHAQVTCVDVTSPVRANGPCVPYGTGGDTCRVVPVNAGPAGIEITTCGNPK
jgi:hypothetical protein